MYELFTPLTPPGATPASPQPTPAPAPSVTDPFVAPAAPAVAFAAPESQPSPSARRSVGPGFVFGAVLASALLASGGTFVAVSAATHNPTAPAVLPAGTVASTGTLQ